MSVVHSSTFCKWQFINAVALYFKVELMVANFIIKILDIILYQYEFVQVFVNVDVSECVKV